MGADTFKALVLRQEDGQTVRAIEELALGALPEGDVLIAVSHSSLNYKDGLAVTGKGKVVRRFPMVPGIDLAGVVEASDSPDFQQGDSVLATGWGLGERHWGGYAQKARLPSQWVNRLPPGLSPAQAMAIGTAGFTAMLCVMALEERGLQPGDGPVLVTGAGGGVGSIAVSLLSALGYAVTASTGRSEVHEYLRSLGAREILDRSALSRSAKPLEPETWAGAVDTVGGLTLATVLSQMRYGQAVATCGNAGGAQLEHTVFPFILRGIALLGMDSVMSPSPRRRQAWFRLATQLPLDRLASMTSEITLAQIPEMAEMILKGQVRGRIVVNLKT
jgi:acrylyl-CoA reductase (NADPH)